MLQVLVPCSTSDINQFELIKNPKKLQELVGEKVYGKVEVGRQYKEKITTTSNITDDVSKGFKN